MTKALRAVLIFAAMSFPPVYEPASAQTPTATSHAEDVRIASQPGVTLEGTLRTPQGKGPFPLMVCLAGSGPNPRGAFKLLDDRLIAEGIATFEYDKRGIGKSTGVFDDSIWPVQADAAAVVRALRARPDIDDARIAVCGISQGAVIGALVAADDSQVAAVVMFSGPSGGKSKMSGLRRILMKAGSTPADIDRIAELLYQWMEARSAKEPAERIAALRAALVEAFTTGSITRETAEGIVASMDTPMVLSMGMVDPAKALARIKVPVLALYGEKDTVVYSAESIPEAKEALKNNPDATVIEIAGATHLFRYEADGPGYPVAIPQVLDLVTHWLVERLHPKTATVQK